MLIRWGALAAIAVLLPQASLAYQTPLVQPTSFLQASTYAPSGGGGGDPTTGLLPSYNDVYANWKNAGLLSTGGIPNRTTQCGATLTPSGGDDTTAINNAITACPTGDVVQLGSGTFKIAMAGMIHLNKGVTLRGSGSCNGTLSVTGGAVNPLCATVIVQNDGMTHSNTGSPVCSGGACSGWPVILMAPAAITDSDGMTWSDCSHANFFVDTADCGGTIAGLTADAAQGATTIQVNTTAPFTVGMYVLITEASGSEWIADPVTARGVGATMWAAADATSSSGSPATGRVVNAKYSGGGGDYGPTDFPYGGSGQAACGAWSFCDRVTQEIHLISAIGAGPCPGVNCTLTFDDPLTVAFRQSGGAQFTGYISGGTLTVTSVASGTITVRAPLTDVASLILGNTYIISQTSGTTGGVGVYSVSNSQTFGSSGSPLPMAAGGYAAKVLYPTTANSGGSPTAVPFLQGASVENLTVQKGNGGNVVMIFCAGCWVKNVDSSEMAAGAVEVQASVRSQIDTVFAHDCWNNTNNGNEYPLDFDWGSTEIYLVNSISRACGKGMTARAGGAASIVAYNYVDDNYYGQGSGLEFWVLDASVNGSHFVGGHHELFEGNWGVNFLNDHQHGNNVYHSYFRNFAAGYRTPFTDPQSGTSVNDFTGVGEGNPIDALRAAVPTAYVYWDAFIGNVLGTAGYSTTANGWSYQSGTGAQAGINIWDLGSDDAAGAYDTLLSGAVASYVFRHGNYDTVTSSVTWDAGTPDHTLPSSFYLASAPAFVGASGAHCVYPWPWVTPTAGSQLQMPTGAGCTATTAGDGLPAKARYDAGTPFVQP